MPRPDLFPAEGADKYYQPKGWTSRHELICDLHMVGYDNREIAKKLELSEGRVSVILSDARADEYIRQQRATARKSLGEDILGSLEGLAPGAIAAIKDDIQMPVMNSKDRAVRQRASFNVLASLGYGPVNKNLNANVGNKETVPQELVERSEKAIADLREMQGKFSYSAPKVLNGEIVEEDDEAA